MTRPLALAAAGVVLGAVAAGAYFSSKNPVTRTSAPFAVASKPISFVNNSAAYKSLEDLDGAFADLADFVSPALVHIKSGSPADNSPQRSFGRAVEQGSGVIYRADGYIVTNDHVVSDANGVVTVILNDGRELEGKVIRGNDPSIDIAVVKVSATDLVAAKFADSKTVRPGQFSLAFGAPFGIENTVTVGHISGLGRTNFIGDPSIQTVRSYTGLIQTDAPINPGNSGGPLVNIHGEVIGINTAIANGSGGMGQSGNVGIGFAIPSNSAQQIADILIEKGKLSRAYMGVALRDLKPFEKKQWNVSGGAYIEQAPADGPAAKAGLKDGDVVTAVNGEQVLTEVDLRMKMYAIDPGARVTLNYLRDGSEKSAQITVSKVPEAVAMNQPRQNTPQTTPRQNDPNSDFFDQFRQDFGDRLSPKVAPPADAPPAARDGKPRLGVSVGDVTADVRTQYSIPETVKGAVVQSVEPGSVAAQLRLQPGDVITRIDGKAIGSADELVAAIRAKKSGDAVSVRSERYAKGASAMTETTVRL